MKKHIKNGIVLVIALFALMGCNFPFFEKKDTFNYEKVEKIAISLYNQNDTIEGNFSYYPLFMLDSALISCDTILCFYPEEHLIKASEKQCNELSGAYRMIGNMPVAVYKNGAVLFVSSRDAGLFNNCTKGIASEKSLRVFENLGNGISRKGRINENWYYYEWCIAN